MLGFWYNLHHMKNALWRSRAVAILGFIVILLLIFPGLPSTLKTSFLLALSFAITCLGLAGSRHKAYHPDQSDVAYTKDCDVSTPKVVVIEDRSAEFGNKAEPIYTEEAIVVSIPAEKSSG